MSLNKRHIYCKEMLHLNWEDKMGTKKFEYPELWDMWSDMHKFSWIQSEFGIYDDEEDILKGLREDTPEEIKVLYEELGDKLEKYWEKNIDVD